MPLESLIAKKAAYIKELTLEEKKALLAHTQERLGDRTGLCDGCRACLTEGKLNFDGTLGYRCLAARIVSISIRENPELARAAMYD